MNDLMQFQYEGRQVRTIERDGEPWFVLRDVCEVLAVGNPSDVARRLDDDEKGVDSIDTPGGIQNMTIINESGLYAVILRSDKPEAKSFRKWVTVEVLPAIRKHGSYSAPEQKPMTQLEMIAAMAAEAAKQERMIQEQGRQIAALTDATTRTVEVIEAIKETVIADPLEWRKWVNHSMAKIAEAVGQDEHRRMRTESYKELEDRSHSNLKIRLENMRMRMAFAGRNPTDINATTRMDVIENDPKLKEIYTAIVKEFRIKYLDTAK